jgi:hypothetical protein
VHAVGFESRSMTGPIAVVAATPSPMKVATSHTAATRERWALRRRCSKRSQVQVAFHQCYPSHSVNVVADSGGPSLPGVRYPP